MSTKVKGRKAQQFPVPPEGLYQAVCADVWDIWTEHGSARFGKQDQLEDKTRLVFEINKTCKEAPLVGKPFQVSQKYTASMHEKANLRKAIESWRGKKLTDEEAKEFELEILVGKNCQLQVVHNLGSDGITYANIAAIVPLAKGMMQMRVSPDFVRKRDRDQQNQQQQQVQETWGEGSEQGFQPSDDDVPF